MTTHTATKYRAVVGFNYRPHQAEPVEVRVEADEVVQLPEHAAKALKEIGAVERVRGE